MGFHGSMPTLCFASLMLFALFSANCQSKAPEAEDFKQQRENMVERQIADRGVRDSRVLAAFRKVPRHLFVPEAYRVEAYEDHPLPIGEGQTISQPYIVAFMTEALAPDSSMKVLEIGTGSGYQAAILGEICREVYTIEIFASLGNRADSLLKSLGYRNITVKVGDGYQGWEAHSPFDAIIVTCSPSHIPQPLKAQLAEGGRMIIPVGERYAQELVLLTKKDGKMIEEAILPVLFVPMIDPEGKKY